ncbi:MAG: site-specific integrase, partial [Rhodospirillaceae bacterium]
GGGGDMATVYSRTESQFYWCRYLTPDGEVRKSTKTSNLLEAYALAAQWENEAKGSQVTLSGAIETFVVAMSKELRPASIRDYRFALDRVVKYLDPYMKDIDSEWVNAWTERRRKSSMAVHSIRMEAYALMRIIKWSGRELTPNKSWPASGMAGRFLSTEEESKLLGACVHAVHRDLIKVTLETGMRKGEVITLHWTEVNLPRREITITAAKSKNRKARIIPLSKVAVQIIFAQSRDCPTVFHLHKVAINQSFNWYYDAREKAGLKDVRFHDLRHTFASRFIHSGGRQEILQRIMGHSTIGQTSRYVYLRTEDLHREMERVSRTGGD